MNSANRFTSPHPRHSVAAVGKVRQTSSSPSCSFSAGATGSDALKAGEFTHPSGTVPASSTRRVNAAQAQDLARESAMFPQGNNASSVVEAHSHPVVLAAMQEASCRTAIGA